MRERGEMIGSDGGSEGDIERERRKILGSRTMVPMVDDYGICIQPPLVTYLGGSFT